jgi:hypothetical protein
MISWEHASSIFRFKLSMQGTGQIIQASYKEGGHWDLCELGMRWSQVQANKNDEQDLLWAHKHT